jgi:hypothetical protein
MLLLSIHHFGRFFFLQIYVLWSVVGSDGFSPSEPAPFPHRSRHSTDTPHPEDVYPPGPFLQRLPTAPTS